VCRSGLHLLDGFFELAASKRLDLASGRELPLLWGMKSLVSAPTAALMSSKSSPAHAVSCTHGSVVGIVTPATLEMSICAPSSERLVYPVTVGSAIVFWFRIPSICSMSEGAPSTWRAPCVLWAYRVQRRAKSVDTA